MKLTELNKKLIMIVSIIFVVFLLVLITIKIVTKNSNLEFVVIENKLTKGAERYFNDNSDLLPSENGKKTHVSITDLEDGKYIPKLNKMVKGDVICNGEVRITNNGGEILYTPYLNCGNTYVTKELYKRVIEENIVTKDDGLYKIGNEHVFRGIRVKNYLRFDDKLWLIIKIDGDNHIKIVEDDTNNISSWDNRYNVDTDGRSGINDFPKSQIQYKLTNLYGRDEYIKKQSKRYIVHKPFCIGKINAKIKRDSNIECSLTTPEQPLGLLQATDVVRASLDKNCNTITSKSCQNYNYFYYLKDSSWTLNAYDKDSLYVYQVANGYALSATATNMSKVRLVLYLSDNVIYNGGTGTYEDPYIIK